MRPTQKATLGKRLRRLAHGSVMEVAATGIGALAGLLLRHHGHHILLDCRAMPVLAPLPPAQQQQLQQHAVAATAPAQRPLLQLQLLLPAALHRWLLQAGEEGQHRLHAVLLTSPLALLGLAALRECLQACGADLPLHTYCSEPCLHAYSQLMRELQDAQACLQHNQQQQQEAVTPNGQQHQQQQQQPQQQPQPTVRVPLPSAQQLQAVLDAVQVVRFGEQLQLAGCFGLTAEARPAGGDIGNCMWHLTLGSHAYTYLCPGSLQPGPSRALHTPYLQGLQVLLLGAGCLSAEQGGQVSADSWPAAAQTALTAARAGGRVLVPVSTGDDDVLRLLDHLELQLSGAAAAKGGAAGSCPAVLYLSPAAADKLATANSCCEYLEPTRQQAVLAVGKAPFACQQMLSAGRLRLMHGASGPLLGGAASSSEGSSSTAAAWSAAVQQVLQLVAPCIVFVPLWSMAGGAGALLTRAWCTNAANMLLLPPSGQAHTTAWLQQCCEQGLLPDRQTWRWHVQPVAAAATLAGGTGNTSSSGTSSLQHLTEGGLLATQLLQLVYQDGKDGSSSSSSSSSSRCQIVASSRDERLLAAAAATGALQQQQQQQQGGCAFDVVLLPDQASTSNSDSAGSTSLAFACIELSPPLVEAALSAELAGQLQLQPLQVTHQPAGQQQQQQQHSGGAAAMASSSSDIVSVAHVRALLARRGQQWLLEPLPADAGAQPAGGGCPTDAAPPLLVVGTVRASVLLLDLQAAGFDACWTPAAGCADQAHAEEADVGAMLVNKGVAEIRLSGPETEIVCDDGDASLRARLLECVLRQLQRIL